MFSSAASIVERKIKETTSRLAEEGHHHSMAESNIEIPGINDLVSKSPNVRSHGDSICTPVR